MHSQRAAKGLDISHVGRLQRGAIARVPTCHPDRKHAGKGLCHSCSVAKWIKANPTANTGAEWLRRNPERRDAHRRKAVLKMTGCTPEQYETLWHKQGGKCANAACSFSAPLKVKNYRDGGLHVDHCHTENRVRGLLCRGCNMAIGHAKEDRARLSGLIDYLARSASEN